MSNPPTQLAPQLLHNMNIQHSSLFERSPRSSYNNQCLYVEGVTPNIHRSTQIPPDQGGLVGMSPKRVRHHDSQQQLATTTTQFMSPGAIAPPTLALRSAHHMVGWTGHHNPISLYKTRQQLAGWYVGGGTIQRRSSRSREREEDVPRCFHSGHPGWS